MTLKWRIARLAGLALLAAVLVSRPAAVAQDSQDDPGSAEQLVGEGLAKMLQALDLLLKSVPQYAAPEVQPNGDILIRRLHPEGDEAPDEPEQKPGESPAEKPAGDSTET